MPLNVEIKAQCAQAEKIKSILNNHQARFVGLDHQVDTYFNVPNGRLKLREGTIENNLIHYQRSNQAGPKTSQVSLYKSNPDSTLKEVLTNALGIFTIVDKQRNIFFIDNVKFHVDEVKNLGSFVEIEAIDKEGNIGEAKLFEQCQKYMDLFEIKENDLIDCSYSDLMQQSNNQ